MAQGSIGILNDLLPRPLSGESFGNRIDKTIDLVRALKEAATNVAATSCGLAIGSSSKKAVATGTFHYWSDGSFKRKAAVETAFTATTHDITADAGAAQERFYLFSISSAGTITVTAGTQGAVGAGTCPALPSGDTPIGLLRLEVAAGPTDFDATTDELDEGHITDEYTSFVGLAWPVDVSALTAPATL